MFVIDHAPDYRESFFQELGSSVILTVVAQPCAPDGLSPPPVRKGYEYIEIMGQKHFGVVWQPGLTRVLHRESWDVICCDLNIRHVSRIVLFLREGRYWNRWVWWGHIFGQNSSMLVERLRYFLVHRSTGCLAYNEEIAGKARNRYGVDAVSLNNTQVRQADFRTGLFTEHSEIRLLFVGRYQPRKYLERLAELAMRRSDVYVRLVGPGMDALQVPDELLTSGRFAVFPRTVGMELDAHFDWADLVANPGHVGLLVMNTAQHGKGIVIDSASVHAPEYWLAKEAQQPFIPFGDALAVDRFLDDVQQSRKKLRDWGDQLQTIARQKYTIEAMAQAHVAKFDAIANKKTR